jgi:hypothetical protein
MSLIQVPLAPRCMVLLLLGLLGILVLLAGLLLAG